jgi:serine/threonine-protein kinase
VRSTLRKLLGFVTGRTAGNSRSPREGLALTADDRDAGPARREPQEQSTETQRQWGHLEIIRRVGGGAFGEVFLAFDTSLKREVALKLFFRCDAALQREAQLLARIKHRNVATVHGAGAHDGRLGLWMEFIHGDTLAELVKRGVLSAREAALVGVDVCHALAALRKAKVVHGDIKAENVMRERGGRIVLTDFGLGRDLGDGKPTSGATVIAGTPPYMAPELLEREKSTVQSDIYAVGVLLFHLVSNSYPVPARDFFQAREAHRRGERQNLRDLRPELPKDFVEIVERACASSPSQRYATAGVMAKELSAFLADLGPVWWTTRRQIIAASTGSITTACLAYALWPVVPAEPVSVLVADFENQTGDPYIDLTVRMLLVHSLEQSRWFHVIPRNQINETLALMLHPPTARLDAATATEICKRDGVAVLISGTVASMGADHHVLVSAWNISTGKVKATIRRPFQRKEDLPRIIDDLAEELRSRLGENWLAQLMGEVKPLEQVTTSSYEALERFSRGLEARDKANMEEAVRWLEAAVQKDKDFSIAHRQLAIAYHSLGKLRESFDSAVVAYGLRKRSSEREQHLIEAFYYVQLGDYWKVVEAYGTVTVLYHRDESAHNQLAQYQAFLGNIDVAVESMKRAVELRPSVLNRGHLAILLAEANREQEALDVIRGARGKQPQDPYWHWGEGLARLGQAQMVAARDEFRSLARAGGVYSCWGRLYEAQTLILEGQLVEAMEVLEAAEAVHLSSANKYTEMLGREWLVRIQLLLGERARALTQLGLLRLPEASPAQQAFRAVRKAALLYIEAGAPTLAEPIVHELQTLATRYPNLCLEGLAAHVQGEWERSAGRAETALENLERARSRWADALTIWSLAEYWDSRQRHERALPLYRDVLARKGTIFRMGFSGMWVLANLRAARCEFKLGNLKDSARYYDRFLHHWGRSGLALAYEAKQERQGLTSLGF